MPWREWKEGDPVTINRIVWDENEEAALDIVLEADWFGPGKQAALFEQELADYTGVEHVLLTNSGTSAIHLAVSTMLHLGLWKQGDLILHPALTFPTSINPVIQQGLVPVFVDVDPGTYVINAEMAAMAVSRYPEIRGAVIPYLLGNLPHMDGLLAALSGRDIVIDSCDTIGGFWKKRPAGTYGSFCAYSFYGSHHITTAGVGGALATRFEENARLSRSMCYWGRVITQNGDPYEDFVNRYTYETMGYDFQMSELQAVWGRVQLDRLRGTYMNERRAALFDRYLEALRPWTWALQLPVEHDGARPSWFAFPITLLEGTPYTREALARHLLEHRIEIRPIFTGDITQQPAYQRLPWHTYGSLVNAQAAGEHGLFLPCWGAMTDPQFEYVVSVLLDYLETTR